MRESGAPSLWAYWRRALREAARNLLPKRPSEVLADIAGWVIALVILRYILAADGSGEAQVSDEIRWGLSVVGALGVLTIASFFVQLVVALPRLQAEAVVAGVNADRASRIDGAVRAIDRRLTEGVRLRERLDHRSSIDTLGLGWVQTVALWQRRCRRTVRHCAPDQYSVFQATVGSDARYAPGLSSNFTPQGKQAEQGRKVIQEWLVALGTVRDAIS